MKYFILILLGILLSTAVFAGSGVFYNSANYNFLDSILITQTLDKIHESDDTLTLDANKVILQAKEVKFESEVCTANCRQLNFTNGILKIGNKGFGINTTGNLTFVAPDTQNSALEFANGAQSFLISQDNLGGIRLINGNNYPVLQTSNTENVIGRSGNYSPYLKLRDGIKLGGVSLTTPTPGAYQADVTTNITHADGSKLSVNDLTLDNPFNLGTNVMTTGLVFDELYITQNFWSAIAAGLKPTAITPNDKALLKYNNAWGDYVTSTSNPIYKRTTVDYSQLISNPQDALTTSKVDSVLGLPAETHRHDVDVIRVWGTATFDDEDTFDCQKYEGGDVKQDVGFDYTISSSVNSSEHFLRTTRTNFSGPYPITEDNEDNCVLTISCPDSSYKMNFFSNRNSQDLGDGASIEQTLKEIFQYSGSSNERQLLTPPNNYSAKVKVQDTASNDYLTFLAICTKMNNDVIEVE